MTAFLYSATASADGYIAGPGGDMSWLLEFMGEEPNPIFELMGQRITALLIGRITFDGDDPNAGDPEKEGAFEGQWAGPQVLLTHRSVDSPPADLIVRHSFDEAVDAARYAAGPDGLVNIIGANIARQCLEAGLLDEVIISTVPIFLGTGTPLLSGARESYGLQLLDEVSSRGPRGAHTRHYRVLH